LNGIFSLNTSFLFLRCMRIHELGVGVKFLYLSLIQIKKTSSCIPYCPEGILRVSPCCRLPHCTEKRCLTTST
jgi:hypothetical protein